MHSGRNHCARLLSRIQSDVACSAWLLFRDVPGYGSIRQLIGSPGIGKSNRCRFRSDLILLIIIWPHKNPLTWGDAHISCWPKILVAGHLILTGEYPQHSKVTQSFRFSSSLGDFFWEAAAWQWLLALRALRRPWTTQENKEKIGQTWSSTICLR